MAITLDGSNGITTDIASNESATFNRDTTDGDLIILQKDNATVGSIGANSSQVYVAGTGAGLKYGTANLRPTNGSGATTDNAVALGSASFRFTDLYLSGGVYLGGTGAANYLDDYEEGTWTPVATSGGGSITSYTASGNYTKIGNFVSAFAIVNFTNVGTASGNLFVTLPFTDNYANIFEQASCTVRETNSTGVIYFARVDRGNGRVSIQTASNGSIVWNSVYRYCFQLNYFTS